MRVPEASRPSASETLPRNRRDLDSTATPPKTVAMQTPINPPTVDPKNRDPTIVAAPPAKPAARPTIIPDLLEETRPLSPKPITHPPSMIPTILLIS